ncbi:MAG: DUF4174 domain-containing protein [Verrucomicrobia bacterium]|nr:DUF4174 domain-containing protein [Verrucomicrobiota bacterium]
MRPFLLPLFLFLSIVPPLPAAPDQRILLIAAPSLNDDAYRTQAALLLPALAGLNERDFVVQIQFGTKSFSVVLIGKDGGEKLRRATPLSPEELFAIVDAMPMRRAEMRGQK